MNLARLYKAALYAVLAAGLLALFFCRGIDELSLLIYTVGLVASWWWPENRPLLPGAWQWIAALLYLIFLPVDLLLPLSRFPLPLLHLVFFVALLKLYHPRSERDDLLLLLIAFGQLLMAASMTVEISFLVTTTFFIFCITLALYLHEIRRRISRQRKLDPAVEDWTTVRTPPRTFVALTVLSTTITLVLAVPIFFVIPRLNEQLFRGYARNQNIATGFSDTVELGQIGRIKQNYQVVFRVRAEWGQGVPAGYPLPADLKWRGMALELYDGRTWRRSSNLASEVFSDPSGRWLIALTMSEALTPGVNYSRGGSWLRQSVYLEPLTLPVLFAVPEVHSISGEVRGLRVDANGSIRFRDSARKRRYVAHSIFRDRRELLRQKVGGAITSEMAAYLQLPPNLDPRVRELSIGLTRSDRNVHEKALRIEQYLLGFNYTLDNPSGGARDPLADFLFRSRSGHCEYFATAHAMMLRTLGVPSRIVNGYRRGELNPLSGDFVVRQANAHSWVEAFFPGIGWVEFDPTPPESDLYSNPVIRWAMHLADSIDLFWVDKVVTLNFVKQTQIFGSARRTVESWARRSWGWAGTLRLRLALWWKSASNRGRVELAAGLGVVLAFFLVAIAGLAALVASKREALYIRYLRWRRHRQVSAILAVYFYQRFLRWAARRGFKKEPAETPLEFAGRFKDSNASAAALEITDCYYRVRFNGEDLTDLAANRLRELLGSLRLKK